MGAKDRALRERAAAVIPGGMYGHQSARLLWPGAPQFMYSGEGSRITDVDGRQYIDLMCSYGPIILGHSHPAVEKAVSRQHRRLDCGNGPAPVMVELAERLVQTVKHADWAMFSKNGTDATTACLTIARAHTQRATILAAKGAYHGAAPWCTPRDGGVLPSDRAYLTYYDYNDLDSVERAVEHHAGDIAGIIVSPFRHDAGRDQELPDPVFASGLRAVCDRTNAVLILDEVRCGLRLAYGGSWEFLGVEPDLSAWSKGIANGYPLAAVLGNAKVREAVSAVFTTGSFWFSADAMAAAVATLDVLAAGDGVSVMHRRGRQLWDGILGQAAARPIDINLTGHVTMPYVTFRGDTDHELADVFTAACAEQGVFLHPRHNWFLSAAHSERDIEDATKAVGRGFDAVISQSARGG
jgi:glutamate-1-semialdehyde 2,1-aminomutase